VGDEELGGVMPPSSLWLQHVALVENTGGGGSNNASSKDMPEKLYFPLIASPYGEKPGSSLMLYLSRTYRSTSTLVEESPPKKLK
jgi:hypothetical protein